MALSSGSSLLLVWGPRSPLSPLYPPPTKEVLASLQECYCLLPRL